MHEIHLSKLDTNKKDFIDTDAFPSPIKIGRDDTNEYGDFFPTSADH